MNMKKESFSLRIIWTLAVCCFLLTTSYGQVFYTKIHAADPDQTRFRFSPSGYTVLSLDGFPDFCLSRQELDLDGQELSWETNCTQLPEEDFVYWLRDDTLLVSNNTFVDNQLLVVKRTVAGDTIWTSSVPKSTQWLYTPMDAKETDSGEIMIIGEAKRLIPPVEYRVFAAKLSSSGELLWNIVEQPSADQDITKIFMEPNPDGSMVYGMFRAGVNGVTSTSLNRRDLAGNLLWSLPLQQSSAFNSFALDTRNGITVSYGQTELPTGNSQIYLQRYDDSGTLTWSADVNTLIGATSVAHSIKPLVTGASQGILFMGKEGSSLNDNVSFIARFDHAGNLIWKKNYSVLSLGPGNHFVGAAPTPDGGFIIGGNADQGVEDFLYVMKIDAGGNLMPGNLEGYLRFDTNDNCVADTSEIGLGNWFVFAASGNEFFTTTNEQGFYSLGLPFGTHQIYVFPPSDLWNICPNGVTVVVPDTGLTTLSQHFSAAAIVDCPAMTISISTPFLRRCFPNVYHVSYCNDGTVTADSVVVEIVLPDELDFNEASIPYTFDGTTFSFQIGAVDALECGSFTITATPDCDDTELGQTICVSAAIYPDTLCNPPANWSGATLAGMANCLGDSVQFVLTNTGFGASAEGLGFVVVDDHVIMMQSPLPSLLPQEQYTATLAAGGTTLRFLAEQEPNHPLSEAVSVGVEGCNGPVQPGALLEFPNTDGRPATARDCHELVGAYDPNDKAATPRGVGDEHYILPGTPLDYRIRFQNTGTDTAFTVVIRDTLDAWLEPLSLKVGAASHAFDFNVTETGILTFIFNNIALPDSNVNEAASHGFVQFSIEHKTDIPMGTLLENRAGIYFDFNPPVITNTVWHTVDTGFLSVVSRVNSLPDEGVQLRVFPNPSAGTFWVEAPEASQSAGDNLLLYNAVGKLVHVQPANGPLTEVKTSLPAGIYLMEWRSGKAVTGRARVVRR